MGAPGGDLAPSERTVPPLRSNLLLVVWIWILTKVGRTTSRAVGQDKTIKHAKPEQTAAGGCGDPPPLAQHVR